MSLMSAILAESPLRRVVQAVLERLPGHWRDKARFDAVGRPQYLVGCFYAADQAKREDYDSVPAIEFGVAEARGWSSSKSTRRRSRMKRACGCVSTASIQAAGCRPGRAITRTTLTYGRRATMRWMPPP
jgi:hypothetical protein